MSNKPEKFIDTHKVVKDKNPKLYKYLPKFIINLFRKLIYEDGVNKVIEGGHDKKGLDFAQHCINEFNPKIIVEGFENIPDEGRFLFAANHPLGGLESIAMMTVVGKKFKNIHFVVNDILLGLKNFEPIFIGVNKHGSTSREAFAKLNEAYNSDNQILFFPAGMVSRKVKGKVTDLEWKKSFVSIACQSDRSIIPVYIHAYNSKFFYNLARFRERIGLKINIEMLFLPSEMFKQKGKTIKFVFGKPITKDEIKSSKLNFNQWAEKIKSIVYNMAPQK